MGHPQTQPQVLRSLVANTGTMMWVEDICEETRLSLKSVQNAMGAILRSGKYHIEVHSRGNCWTYKGPATVQVETPAVDVNSAYPKATESAYHKKLSANATYGKNEVRTFTELTGIKWTEKGAILIVDGEGNLYRATKI